MWVLLRFEMLFKENDCVIYNFSIIVDSGVIMFGFIGCVGW